MFFLPLLAAITIIEPSVSAKLLGWSADGHFLVWTDSASETTTPEYKDDGSMGDPDSMAPTLDESATFATVLDVRKNEKQFFLLKYTAHSPKGKKAGTLKKKYSTAGDAAAFEAWKKKSPLALTADKKGKSGTANITVKLDEGSPAAWKGNSMGWSVENSAKVTLSTTCGKVTNSETIEQAMGAMYTPSWKATPHWDPSGRHVVFLMEEAVAKTMRGPDGGHRQYVIVPCGLRVSVVGPADAAAQKDKVAAALETAGYNISDIGPAKAKRPATVIYADGANTAEAEKLAKLVPGGATVDKLTWKPKADIVVAVGDSAK